MSERSLMIETVDTKPTLRRRIIEAADTLIREHGLGGATTREIAKAAGCAEGSIYVHFEDKIDLVIAVVVEREPYYEELLELPEKAGEGTLEGNLVPWLEELLTLMRENQPIFFALMSDRAVFKRFKARLAEREVGPVAVYRAAEAYIRAEQDLGRVEPSAQPGVVAAFLIGGCRDQVVAHALAGTVDMSSADYARALAHTIVFGLAPESARGASTPKTLDVEEEPS
jgi:AcrR family transcriptional regulator